MKKNSSPVLQQEIPTIPTELILHEDDEEAGTLQAPRHHRHHASTIVRDHLEHHAANNSAASSDYVTWIATLHPENADSTVDQRFFVPGNPWWTIYEDTKNTSSPVAKAVPVPSCDDVTKKQQQQQQQQQQQGSRNNTPVVGAAEDEEAGASNAPTEASHEDGRDSSRPDTPRTTTKTKSPHFCQTCNPFGIVFGLLVAIPALVVALACELVALLVCHLPGTLFYHAAQVFAPPDCCTCLLYGIFRMGHGILSLCDSMVLVGSVVVTEFVGLVALGVGFLTGGCVWAWYLHQQIRRLCHGIRIVFRHTSATHNNPPRRLFCDRTVERRDAKPHREGVTVIRVERVRCPGESCH